MVRILFQAVEGEGKAEAEGLLNLTNWRKFRAFGRQER
jgi:hypothetical protein